MSNATGATTTDDPRPEGITVEQIATDLSLSNEEGTSWFGYGYDKETDTLLIQMYGEHGQIIKNYKATITFKGASKWLAKQ